MNRVSIVLALGLLAVAGPASARAQEAQAGASSNSSEQTFFDFQVDQAAKVKFSRPPLYPDRPRNTNFDGQVIVQFVVDESGAAQMNTFKVLKSTDNEQSESVRRAVNGSSYFPAEFHGRKVRQLVQQQFKFSPRS